MYPVRLMKVFPALTAENSNAVNFYEKIPTEGECRKRDKLLKNPLQ